MRASQVLDRGSCGPAEAWAEPDVGQGFLGLGPVRARPGLEKREGVGEPMYGLPHISNVL